LKPNIVRISALALALMVIAACFLSTGCGSSSSPSSADRVAEEEVENNTPAGISDGQGVAVQTNSRTIDMCGRSVLYGWFAHWGWDGDSANPVSFAGYRVIYHEMDSPPGITDSALAVIRRMKQQGDEIMFFKLCFVDFTGGDQNSARENLMANEGIIRSVVDAAQDNGLLLIIGNALPNVREYTDSWLIWNHNEYNRFLETLSGQYPGRVIILDLYGALASPEGWLRPGYASSPDDAHPNDAGYAALDKVLQAVLVRLAASP
jgi:hypothetical protein